MRGLVRGLGSFDLNMGKHNCSVVKRIAFNLGGTFYKNSSHQSLRH